MSGNEEDVYLFCHRCGVDLQPGEGDWYQVAIEAVADPNPPAIISGMSAGEIDGEIAAIIESVKGATEKELLDEVYRNLTLHLCRGCFKEWIENPVASTR